MPFVLTTASSVKCAGQGTVAARGQNKLKVSGAPVLRIDGIMGKSIAGCATPTDSNSGSKTCATVASASGAASKLKVSGAAVALGTLSGAGDGAKSSTPDALSATPNQTKLMAS